MRIVSLVPSATEMVFAAGLGDSVVGVTHECDYPPAARNLPRAYQWFDVAARQGDGDAAAKRNEIAKRLAPPELAAARLLAERWRARPTDKAANEVIWSTDDRTALFDPHFGGKI